MDDAGAGGRPEQQPGDGTSAPAGIDLPITRVEPDSLPDASSPGASFDAGLVMPESSVGGVESRILLARARKSLLGWDEAPVQVGRYRILERIGTGGMGVVYSAQDDELDRQVAIKILRHDLAPGSTGRQRLLREAQATARLSHPNVIHVYEVGQEGDQVFMAMELVRGDTLRAWQSATARTWLEVVEMYVRAGEGLAAAHAEGIIHRDFKPDNVLVGRDGRPRVLDFGLARVASETMSSSEALPQYGVDTGSQPLVGAAASGSGALRDLDLTRTGTVVGTPAYMAPEQLERAEPDARSDQFSFCVALFEALYGDRPFAGATYTELAKNVTRGAPRQVDPRKGGAPRAIHAAILTGLLRAPEARHRDMRALLAALQQASRSTSTPRRAWAIAGVIGLGAAAATAAAMLPEPRDATETEPISAAEPQALEPSHPWADIVAASDLPNPVPQRLPGDPTGTTIHRLDNGLTVYVVSRPLEPLVTASVIIRAGSAEEGEADQGLSQLVLASVLEGSERLGVRDAALERPLRIQSHALLAALNQTDDAAARDAMVRAAAAAETAAASSTLGNEFFSAAVELGGHNPLTVSGQGSILSVDIPTHRFAAWAELTAEVLQRPTFRGFVGVCADKLEFLGWIAEGGHADQTMGRAMAPATGVVDDFEIAAARIAKLPLVDAKRFWSEYYRPNNTALVLIGDITAADALPILARHFGDWEPAPIPARPGAAVPLTAPSTLIEVEDAGAPLALFGWPLPPSDTRAYVDRVALSRVLNGPDGLLAHRLRDITSGGGATIMPRHYFEIGMYPAAGTSLDDTRGLIFGVLEDIAAGRIPEPAWQRALGGAELDRQRWARSNGTLTRFIVASYLGRLPWTETVRRLGPEPIDRAGVIGAAKALLDEPHVVVHRNPGKPWSLDTPRLPVQRAQPTTGEHSELVRALIDAPTAPMEPRFLVEGSHWSARAHGKGRIITAEDSGSPLVRLTWIHPVGAAEDPWICDAITAYLDHIPVAGFEAVPYCTTTDTHIGIIGTATAFEAALPELLAWLGGGTTLAPDVLANHAARTLQWRHEARADPWDRASALHAFALRGAAMLDVMLPDDDTLVRDAPAGMAAALQTLGQYDPDILYVGPRPQALHDALPPPRGATLGLPTSRATRTVDTPTVFVLDDPERGDVSVRAALPWIAQTPREHLAARIHRSEAQAAAWGVARGLESEGLEYFAPWSPNAPLAIGVGLRAPNDKLDVAVQGAIELLHQRPSEADFDGARQLLETTYRAARVPARDIPGRVREWPAGTSDPRVAQWLALPSLDYADVSRYYAEIDARVPIVSVVGDLEALDLAGLAEHGEIVHVELDDILRDPVLYELIDGSPDMMTE